MKESAMMAQASPAILYPRLLQHYQNMQQLAALNDWDAFVAEEKNVQQIRQQLILSHELKITPELQHIIQEILMIDEAMQKHTQPALASMRKLLSSTSQDRNIRKAYGDASMP